MIENIQLSGVRYEISEDFSKYALKRIGKLDKFLPKKNRKDVVAKIVVTQVDRAHGNKYEISAAIDVPGGRVIAAKDEASNVFAGIDIIEAKLMGQIRRFKTEKTDHVQKGFFKKILKK